MQFSNKFSNDFDLKITYENNYISTVNETKFLGLNINNALTWLTHIEKIVPKLCSACFAMRSVKPFVFQQMLQIIYFSSFHSIMSYGLIFWGHSPHSVRVFRLQKRIISVMTGSGSRDSCRTLFICLKILPLPSLYIFLFLRFVIKNKDLFTINNEIHKIDTRHLPSVRLKKFQTGIFYMGIKIYNSIPLHIKEESSNINKFLSLLKNFLGENSIYSLGDFYDFCKSK